MSSSYYSSQCSSSSISIEELLKNQKSSPNKNKKKKKKNQRHLYPVKPKKDDQQIRKKELTKLMIHLLPEEVHRLIWKQIFTIVILEINTLTRYLFYKKLADCYPLHCPTCPPSPGDLLYQLMKEKGIPKPSITYKQEQQFFNAFIIARNTFRFGIYYWLYNNIETYVKHKINLNKQHLDL